MAKGVSLKRKSERDIFLLVGLQFGEEYGEWGEEVKCPLRLFSFQVFVCWFFKLIFLVIWIHFFSPLLRKVAFLGIIFAVKPFCLYMMEV